MAAIAVQKFGGQVAFITGGGSGIGLAVGRALSARGASVVLADVDAKALQRAAQDFPGPVETIQMDVRNRADWAEARARTEERCGVVHILMNNAGIINDLDAPMEQRGLVDQSFESFDLVIAINLTGVFNGIATFGPGMRDRGEGHIVNTSSSQGVISCQGVGSYCASKYGVVALSETLRAELALNGVGVSVLCPGVVETGLPVSSAKLTGGTPSEFPPGYGLDPAEVAEMTIKAIIENRPYIFTHGEYAAPVMRRHREIEAALADTPVSRLFDSTTPLQGTPEWAEVVASR